MTLSKQKNKDGFEIKRKRLMQLKEERIQKEKKIFSIRLRKKIKFQANIHMQGQKNMEKQNSGKGPLFFDTSMGICF